DRHRHDHPGCPGARIKTVRSHMSVADLAKLAVKYQPRTHAELRAAYRNRTDDLRIRRRLARRSRHDTCTDGRTCVPECSERTARTRSRAMTRATAWPAQVTECY